MADKHKPGFDPGDGTGGGGSGTRPKSKVPTLIWILAAAVLGLVAYGYYTGGI